MTDQDQPTGPRWAMWMSLLAAVFFALAAVYAAFKAETDGDLAMAALAIPMFCWAAAVFVGSLRGAYRKRSG